VAGRRRGMGRRSQDELQGIQRRVGLSLGARLEGRKGIRRGPPIREGLSLPQFGARSGSRRGSLHEKQRLAGRTGLGGHGWLGWEAQSEQLRHLAEIAQLMAAEWIPDRGRRSTVGGGFDWRNHAAGSGASGAELRTAGAVRYLSRHGGRPRPQ
jgi:hypothetical protein